MTAGELDLLVDAARAGGGWAFGRLWEGLSPVVCAYVRARGVRDPDDITSEVFLAAFTRMDRFTGDGRAFRSWLFTIAHHRSTDAVRRPSREIPTDIVDDGRRTASAEETALARLGSDETLRLLNLLTDEQRSVVLLRVVGELSLEETAAAVGRPVGAVKSLQHRALARLRREISAQAVSPDAWDAIARLR